MHGPSLVLAILLFCLVFVLLLLSCFVFPPTYCIIQYFILKHDVKEDVAVIGLEFYKIAGIVLLVATLCLYVPGVVLALVFFVAHIWMMPMILYDHLKEKFVD